jgi:hypothetical protein
MPSFGGVRPPEERPKGLGTLQLPSSREVGSDMRLRRIYYVFLVFGRSFLLRGNYEVKCATTLRRTQNVLLWGSNMLFVYYLSKFCLRRSKSVKNFPAALKNWKIGSHTFDVVFKFVHFYISILARFWRSI